VHTPTLELSVPVLQAPLELVPPLAAKCSAKFFLKAVMQAGI